jgi:hypothetical protein
MAKKITLSRLQGIVYHCLETDHRLKEGKDFNLTFDQGASGGVHKVTAEFHCNTPHVYEGALRALSGRYKFTFAKAPARELQEA